MRCVIRASCRTCCRLSRNRRVHRPCIEAADVRLHACETPMTTKTRFNLQTHYPAMQPLLALSQQIRSEEHTSELQSLMRISYAVFCLKKKKTKETQSTQQQTKLNRTY